MRVMAAIDTGEQRTPALTLGARLATDGFLLIATVAEPDGPAPDLTLDADDQQLPADVQTRRIPDGDVAAALARTAADEAIDLIVIGSAHRGPVGRALLGTTGERLLRAVGCPVAVAPRDYKPPAGRFVSVGVCHDGSDGAERALAWAEQLAVDVGATATLIRAISSPIPAGIAPPTLPTSSPPVAVLERTARQSAERQLWDAADRLSPKVHANTRIVMGAPRDMLTSAAKDYDLVVVGSRTLGPLGRHALGSVSRHMMHDAPTPIVVVA